MIALLRNNYKEITILILYPSAINLIKNNATTKVCY
jgi:hypothetical protein